MPYKTLIKILFRHSTFLKHNKLSGHITRNSIKLLLLLLLISSLKSIKFVRKLGLEFSVFPCMLSISILL